MADDLNRTFHNPAQKLLQADDQMLRTEKHFYLPRNWRQVNNILWPKNKKAANGLKTPYNASLLSSLRMDTSAVTLPFVSMMSSPDAVTLCPLCGQWKKIGISRDVKISI